MSFRCVLSGLSGWTADADGVGAESKVIKHDPTPDVSSIPPLLRRRLNLLGRACASEVLAALPDDPTTPIVYCSQHGDIERTLRILEDLAETNSVSPKDFSLAVHNAICGVLSIHAGLIGPINTIAAGQQSLVPVLLEAIGLLSPNRPKVLCVMCDVPLPAVYRTSESEPRAPYAVCFTLGLVADEAAIGSGSQGAQTLQLQQLPGASTGRQAYTALDFCSFLESAEQQSILIEHNHSSWGISKG